jgi:hypothetical protein
MLACWTATTAFGKEDIRIRAATPTVGKDDPTRGKAGTTLAVGKDAFFVRTRTTCAVGKDSLLFRAETLVIDWGLASDYAITAFSIPEPVSRAGIIA